MRYMLYPLISILLSCVLQLAAARAPCNVNSNTTMVHDARAEQARLDTRSASALRAGFAQPWPPLIRNGQQLRIIKYCYATKLYRDYLHCNKFNPALKIWADKLGFPASAQTGHSVAWEEAAGVGEDGKRKRRYCYTKYEHGKGGKWNKNVEPDTLAIFLDPTFDGARATTGYDAVSSEPGKHQMILGVDVDPIEIAHELGHVFGMVHEHVRNDRDDYVVYKCENVQGFASALSKALAENVPEAEARKLLCEDRAFAEKYQFMGSQFTKNPRGAIHDEPGGFDIDSIMMYDSSVFAEPPCDVDKSKCPLLKLVKVNGEVVGTNRILENTEPSAGDVAWVKKWYPHSGGLGQS